jgi:hypothetical protein
MNIAGSIPAPAIMGSTMDNIFCTFSSSKAQARSSNRSVYAVRLRRTHSDMAMSSMMDVTGTVVRPAVGHGCPIADF